MIVVSISLGTFRLMPVVELMTDGVAVVVGVDKSLIPLLGTIPNSAA